MIPMDKYFKPKSVTWWAAAALLAYGLLSQDPEKILEGLAGIGLRGAIR